MSFLHITEGFYITRRRVEASVACASCKGIIHAPTPQQVAAKLPSCGKPKCDSNLRTLRNKQLRARIKNRKAKSVA